MPTTGTSFLLFAAWLLITLPSILSFSVTPSKIVTPSPSTDDLWKQAGATSRRKRRRGRKPVVQKEHMPTSIRTRNLPPKRGTGKCRTSKEDEADLIPKEEIASISLTQQQIVDGTPQIMANVKLANGTEWMIPPHDLHQRKHQSVWLEVRSLLDVTASEFSAVVGNSVFTTRETLLGRKIGSISSSFKGNVKAMEWGLRMEPKAFRQYCDVTGNDVDETGLHVMMSKSSLLDGDDDNIYWKLGASPDGLVVDAKDGSLGLLEIKCLWGRRNKKKEMPQWENCPNRFFDQIQGQLAVCDREWCDLMCYVPPSNRFRKNYCIIRVPRNHKYWSETLLPELEKFCAEVDKGKN